MSKRDMDYRSYGLVTASYWGFTLTDGALRMLVLLHFHELGYTPVHLAFLFLLYEFCGIVTNLFGGWIGSRLGLRFTLFAGLATQIVALLMLSMTQPEWAVGLSVAYVMAAQALSGIAKDLTKMSSKSTVKLLVKEDAEDSTEERGSRLFTWVAILTGSKNALKGCGFLLGGVLLQTTGFTVSLWVMAGALAAMLLISIVLLKTQIGKSKDKVRFRQLFSKTREINVLSLARLFLFGSRDVWFVVGLPVFLSEQLGWSFAGVGAFLSVWVIGYGVIQAGAPQILKRPADADAGASHAKVWGFLLTALTGTIAVALQLDFHPTATVLVGLILFGIIFAVNSSVHSFLILAYTDEDKVALNVGFYYMANACGRLVGTLLSGITYIIAGLPGCLWVSAGFVLVAAGLTLLLPKSGSSIVTEDVSQAASTARSF